MGHTFVEIKLFSLDHRTSEKLSLLVDTGSTYSWVTASILNRLGIVQKARKLFKTIEGRQVERGIGEAVIEYNGETATTVVVFGEEKDSQVLGVYALEGLGLQLDPITEKIKKVEALLAV